jgi:hypothetical protein
MDSNFPGRVQKLLARNYTFGLEAEIDNYVFGRDAEDCTREDFVAGWRTKVGVVVKELLVALRDLLVHLLVVLLLGHAPLRPSLPHHPVAVKRRVRDRRGLERSPSSCMLRDETMMCYQQITDRTVC